jgi:acetyltransferase
LSADPDKLAAEYAVMVRSDVTGSGLGYSLMCQILEYARENGIGRVFGDVLRENDRMLRMARDLGFTTQAPDEDSDTITVEILLTDATDRDSAEA